MDYLLILIILIIIGYFVNKFVISKEQNNNTEVTKITKESYHAKDYILTKAEMKFYDILCKAIADTYLEIWPMLSLKEIVFVRDEEGKKNSYKYFNKINRKHIDFTLVNPKSSKIILCIELDDKSHNRKDRIERDNFIDEVMKQAGIKLVHIPVTIEYDIDYLKNIINASLP